MIKIRDLQKLRQHSFIVTIAMLLPLLSANAMCKMDASYESLTPVLAEQCNGNPSQDAVSYDSVKNCATTDYPPTFFLRHLSLLLLKKVNEQQVQLDDDPAHLHRIVSDILLPFIDQRKMAALTVMQYWKNATEQEKIDFIHEYTRKVVHDYGSAMLLYKKETVCVPTLYLGNGRSRKKVNKMADFSNQKRLKVKSTITSPSSDKPIEVEYRVRKMQPSLGSQQASPVWKIYNIRVNSLNMAASYRAQFQEVVADKNKGFPGLIKQLKDLNDKNDQKGSKQKD